VDEGNSIPKFKVGDKVFLLGTHIKRQHPNKKLDHKQYDPFPVTEFIGSHAYQLAPPQTMKIDNVFHANLLIPVKKDGEFHHNFTPPPPVITEEGEEQYQVEKLVIGRWKPDFGSTGSGGKDMGPLMILGNLQAGFYTLKINCGSSTLIT
jgi:hypothetical protein